MIGATETKSRSRDLIDASLVWDNHGCMPLRPHDNGFLPQLQRYRAAGVDVAFLNIGFGEQGIEEHIRVLAAFRHWLMQHADLYTIIQTADDIVTARASGRLAVAFDIEGGNGIADQPSLIQLYYDLGVRWMLVAYNRNNRMGGGCQDDDCGLSEFGRTVLDEMARVGMIPCVSHTGYRTAHDVCAYHRMPVILSHSNARAIHDHPRNVPDDLLRAVAATGGVVGVNGIGPFLEDGGASTSAYLRHLDHMVQTIGAAHVGIGLDYVFDASELDDLIIANPEAFPPELGYRPGCFPMVEPERIEAVVEGMIQMGYDDGDISQILGGNFMRVARESWKPVRLCVEIATPVC